MEGFRRAEEISSSLKEWLPSAGAQDLKNLFLNMDIGMRYLHSRGFYIESFDPSKVEILNNSSEQIRYTSIEKLSNDEAYNREIIRENIYRFALLQIGIYTNCTDYINPSVVKSDFDSFCSFIPQQDVPYYRGVIERGANVYFSDYVAEMEKRNMESLSTDGVPPLGQGRQYVKGTGINKSLESLNSDVNGEIYVKEKMSNAAFISLLVIPTAVAVFGVIFAIIAWITSFK